MFPYRGVQRPTDPSATLPSPCPTTRTVLAPGPWDTVTRGTASLSVDERTVLRGAPKRHSKSPVSAVVPCLFNEEGPPYTLLLDGVRASVVLSTLDTFFTTYTINKCGT